MKALSSKIKKLTQEAESLVNRRSELEKEFRNIETRLTQIVGALQELQSLENEVKHEDRENTGKTDNKPEFHKSVQKAN